MRNRISDPKQLDLTVKLPKDFHWKVLGSLVKDLGVGDISSDNYLPDNFGILGAIRGRNLDKLLQIQREINPRSMVDLLGDKPYAFFAYYQLSCFLKKFPFTGINTREAALENFKKAERICELYNSVNHKALLSLDLHHPKYLGIIDELRADILQLLGDSPNVDRVYTCAKHGPGTSLSPMYRNGKTTSYFKWSTLPYSVTSSALPYARAAIESDPRWVGALQDWYRRKEGIPVCSPINIESFWKEIFEICECSRITTVPKTVLTDRTIAIEPVMNVYLQLGIDGIIRARLKKRWGYDLNDQTVNQRLAQQGSIDGSLATLDLSAASDTISLYICYLLLPPMWFDLFCDLRCKKGQIDGEEFSFQKMSSMGNGFTFALESVIFGALTRCAIRRTGCDRVSAVYGDDIIVPSPAYKELTELLSLCGFSVNLDKSYCQGPFRESCGADYLSGYSVRPIFLKREVKTVQDLLYLHNSLYQLGEAQKWVYGYDYRNVLSLLRNYLPSWVKDKCYGPPSESLDTYLFSEKLLPLKSGGYRSGYCIQVSPRLFNRGTEFFFRKLMVRLSPNSQATYRWDRNRTFDTGNAFDVTKRDVTVARIVKKQHWPTPICSIDIVPPSLRGHAL